MDNTFFTEEEVWKGINSDHLWALDKLILSRKLGYVCGPTGTSVPQPGTYIVRPCINAHGLGLEASIQHIDSSTDHLPPGHFWCEIFEGTHYSVDYVGGLWNMTVVGEKPNDTLTRWKRWYRIEQKILLPRILRPFAFDYTFINCEFIGDKLIEIHFRNNPDFLHGNIEYIPVWEGEDTTPPWGYTFIEDSEIHGRIGAFIR